MQESVLARIQRWYVAQCDGAWEHQFGVRIETLDNPGWLVTIHLQDTNLSNRPFDSVNEGIGDKQHPERSRWISCQVRDGVWKGAGDETQLERLLKIFLDWSLE